MAKNYVHYMTPVGVFAFPKLHEIDVYKAPNGQVKKRYKTNMEFTPEVLAQVKADIAALIKKHDMDVGKNVNEPFQKSKKDGRETLVATSGEERKPPIFDSRNQKLPEGTKVTGGSKGRLDVTVNPYTGFGGGVNLYINGVQLIEKAEYAYQPRFEETEGYTREEAEGEFPASDNVGEETAKANDF